MFFGWPVAELQGYCQAGIAEVVGQAAVCLLVFYHRADLAAGASALQICGGVIDGVAALLFLLFLWRRPQARPAPRV